MEAVVVDIGSSSIKAGWAGDDVPSIIFPSVISKYPYSVHSIEASAIESNSPHDADHPYQRGTVKDWSRMEALWSHIFNELGLESFTPSAKTAATSEHATCPAFLIVESPKSPVTDRLKTAKILFERFKVPSISIGNSSSLTVFASGRTTGIAIDCGAGLSSSVPVFEGLALSHAAVVSEFGGQDISAGLQKLLEIQGIRLDLQNTKYLKENMAFVSAFRSIREKDSQKNAKERQSKTFTLPDGTEITCDSSVFQKCTNAIWDSSVDRSGLTDQVLESISLCDDSIRRDMANNIILAGGTSTIKGLADRLSGDLNVKLAGILEGRGSAVTYGVRVIPSKQAREPGYTHQSKYAAWIGGSIIASLDSFKDLQLTRQEWDERGPDAATLHSKCF